MQTYLVGFSVVSKGGNSTSRIFKQLPIGQIVTAEIIHLWEYEICPLYDRLPGVIILVFTFQPL